MSPAGPGVTVKAAVGAWSGVMAMPAGLVPTGDRRAGRVGGRGDRGHGVADVVGDVGGLAVGGDGDGVGIGSRRDGVPAVLVASVDRGHRARCRELAT